MKFKHLQIHVRHDLTQYLGSWMITQTQDADRALGESDIPLGKRLSKAKLEDFALDVIAQADAFLLKNEGNESWKGVKMAGKPLVEVFNPGFEKR